MRRSMQRSCWLWNSSRRRRVRKPEYEGLVRSASVSSRSTISRVRELEVVEASGQLTLAGVELDGAARAPGLRDMSDGSQ